MPKKRKKQKTRPIWTFDSETDPFVKGRYPMPFCCDIFDGDEHFSWWGADCVDQAVAFLLDKNVIVYAHNGGKFDYFYMLSWLLPGDEPTIINGRLASFKIGECEFRDSFNLIPYSLASYQKSEIDYMKFEADVRESHKAEIISYLESDTENLYDLVTGFINEYGTHLTQAGAAMSYYQTMSEKKADKTDEQYYSEFAPYYYGGRVEAIKPGIHHGNFIGVDINSAYPFAMLRNHPTGTARYSGTASVRELANNSENWSHAFFTIDAVSRGAFPFRDVDSGRLTFPRDNVRRIYHVSGWELFASLETETADIFNVLHMICHDAVINFDTYISYFFQKRLEAKAAGDKKQDLFCKIFMNSLYGKFGADPGEYCDYLIADYASMKSAEYRHYEFAGTLGPNILMSRPIAEETRRYYNVATAASITGFVRAYLWKALSRAINPLYCDTDCIIAESVNVDTGKRLGQWEIEGAYDLCAIAGKKLYALRDKESGEYKTRSKGVRLNADEILTICKGGTVSYTRDVPTYSIKKTPSFNTREVKMT